MAHGGKVKLSRIESVSFVFFLCDRLSYSLVFCSFANLNIPFTSGSVQQEQEMIGLLLLTLWDSADRSTQH